MTGPVSRAAVFSRTIYVREGSENPQAAVVGERSIVDGKKFSAHLLAFNPKDTQEYLAGPLYLLRA